MRDFEWRALLVDRSFRPGPPVREWELQPYLVLRRPISALPLVTHGELLGKFETGTPHFSVCIRISLVGFPDGSVVRPCLKLLITVADNSSHPTPVSWLSQLFGPALNQHTSLVVCFLWSTFIPGRPSLRRLARRFQEVFSLPLKMRVLWKLVHWWRSCAAAFCVFCHGLCHVSPLGVRHGGVGKSFCACWFVFCASGVQRDGSCPPPFRHSSMNSSLRNLCCQSKQVVSCAEERRGTCFERK